MSDWRDGDGELLGDWEVVTDREWARIFDEAGGYDALTVFASLTDPEGDYGEPQVYTAWGRPDDDVPLLDICDYGEPGFGSRDWTRRVTRKFVPRQSSERAA